MSPYKVPTAGTFYVPPRWAERVASLPPLTGDFAAGSRTLPSRVIVAGLPTPVTPGFNKAMDEAGLRLRV